MSARTHGRWAVAAAAAALLYCVAAFAQTIISVRAGLLNDTAGCVLLEGKHIEYQPTHVIHLRPHQQLRTEDGHAEVLLGPEIFLRMGFESKIEMVSTDLTAPQVRLLSGSALIDANGLTDQCPVSVMVGRTEIRLVKKGLYRIEAPESGPAVLMVWNGQAIVVGADRKKAIPERHAVELAENLQSFVVRRAERSKEDPLDTWSRERSSEIAQVNGELLRKQAEEDERSDRFRLPTDWGILGH
jgi:hypothetical protein